MIKQRVMQLIEYKKLPKMKFFEEIGISSGNFRGEQAKSALGSNIIEKIIAVIPDVNLRWLITGEGEMTINPTEKMVAPNIAPEVEARLWTLIESQQRTIELQQRTIDKLVHAGKGDAEGVGGVAAAAAHG